METQVPRSPAGSASRTDALLRVALGVPGLSSLLVGAWAQLAPRSFYDDFPGGGRTWVSVDGPYNEHLVRDVGGLNLALAALLLVAAWRGGTVLVRTGAVAALLYGVPHLVYHVAHRERFSTGDQVANVGALALAVVLPLVALVVSAGRRRELA
jgi:hypothetical protein